MSGTGGWRDASVDPLTLRRWLAATAVLAIAVGAVHYVIATYFPPVRPDLPRLAAGSAVTGVITLVIGYRLRSWWWLAAPAVIATAAVFILTGKDLVTDNLSQAAEQVFLFRVGLFGAWWVVMSVTAVVGTRLGKRALQ